MENLVSENLKKEEPIIMYNNSIKNTKYVDSYNIIYESKEDVPEIVDTYQYYIEKWHRQKYEKPYTSQPNVTNITNISTRGITTVFTYITQFVIYIVDVFPNNTIEPIHITVNIQLRKTPGNRTLDNSDYEEVFELSKKIKKRVYLDNNYSNIQANKNKDYLNLLT